ncbi:MAG: N-acetylglucosamine-6-phosphate deacetylase [Spirochaetota bacterium]
MTKRTLIKNGRVITETLEIGDGWVLIEDGKIRSFGETGDGTPSADETIDAEKNIVSPGFIDMHTHGIKDVDFMEADEEAMERGLKEYARFGVTRVVGSTLSNPIDNIIRQMKRMRSVREESDLGDLLVGGHMEGPWLCVRCRGGHAEEYLTHPTEEVVERLMKEAGDVIVSVTYAPELENSLMLTEALSYHGILPVLGHTEASYDDAERVIHAGARHVTHMYDTTMGYGEDPNEALVMMPGMETAVLHYDEVSIELIGCPVHVPKPFFKFINQVKPRDKKIIVTDSLVGTGMEEHAELTYEDGHTVYVEKGVLRMKSDDPRINGNLTGSAVTIDVALKRLRDFADIPTREAVRWGSLNPARTLGIDRETGSIAVGKYGDIVIMDDDFNVKRTLLKGKTICENRDG